MLEKSQIPAELIDRYNKKRCAFFVGAGLSQGAGLPNWKQFLMHLLDEAKSRGLMREDQIEECTALLNDSTKYLMVAEEIRENLQSHFGRLLDQLFLNPDLEPTGAHRLLVQCDKATLILTTNYDVLIEDAFARERKRPRSFKYYESGSIQKSLFDRQFFILKAHGEAGLTPDQIIISDKDYKRVLYRELGYRSALHSIFTMNSMIFIGASLTDPEFRLLIDYINAAFPESGPVHYALMNGDDIDQTEKNRFYKDHHIEIIPISPDENYKDIERFLEVLSVE